MLSDIILLGDKSGSFALADAKQSALVAALQALLNNIADVFNGKAIPDLFYLNNFDGITDFPKLVPGQLQSPTLKEVALMLRAWGVDVDSDLELNNHIRTLMGFPSMDKEEYKEMMNRKKEAQEQNSSGTNNSGLNRVRNDTAEREFEQNNMNYTDTETEDL